MKSYNLLIAIFCLSVFSCSNSHKQELFELKIKMRALEDSIKVTDSKFLVVKNYYDSLSNFGDSTNKDVLINMNSKEHLMFDYSLRAIELNDSLNKIKFSIESLTKLK
jgi:hypothetical protein